MGPGAIARPNLPQELAATTSALIYLAFCGALCRLCSERNVNTTGAGGENPGNLFVNRSGLNGASVHRWQLTHLRDPEKFAQAWHMLMKGSIVSAGEGNKNAARDAKRAARLILDGWARKP
jgi:hypothetical protein